MNCVTFRIEETLDGDFILYLHNNHQQEVYEHFRSKKLGRGCG